MSTTKLNKTTKKAENWIKSYFNSSCYSVRNFYKSKVTCKVAIEEGIKRRMTADNLIDYRVINGNSFYFTCGYMTADRKTLFVETISNIFEIAL